MTNKTILKINLVISVLIFTIVCSTPAPSFLMSSNPSIFAKIQKNCFDSKLTGKSEVPPKDTKATGFVQLNANEGNNSMRYKINVSNIEKATSGTFTPRKSR